MIDQFSEIAWGSPIKEASKTWEVGEVKLPKSPTSFLERNGVIVVAESIKAPPEVQTVISELKDLAGRIESTITYYLTQKGQSMAANHLSFVKKDILDNVARLEKACPNQ